METADAAQYELTSGELPGFTLIVGGLASCGGRFLFSIRVGARSAGRGAGWPWINFRWLERDMTSVTARDGASGSPEARVPVTSYLGMFARYA